MKLFPRGFAVVLPWLRWRSWGWGALAILVATGGALGWLLLPGEAGDPALRGFVHARPPVPVVFTSRSSAASLQAAAPEGEGFDFPGQPLWQAPEGRLRLLTPAGAARELT